MDIVVEQRKDLLTIFFWGTVHTIINDSPISKTDQVPGVDIQEVRNKGPECDGQGSLVIRQKKKIIRRETSH